MGKNLTSPDSTSGKECNFLWEKRHLNLPQVIITCDDLQSVATISYSIGDWLLKEYLSELGGTILG